VGVDGDEFHCIDFFDHVAVAVIFVGGDVAEGIDLCDHIAAVIIFEGGDISCGVGHVCEASTLVVMECICVADFIADITLQQIFMLRELLKESQEIQPLIVLLQD